MSPLIAQLAAKGGKIGALANTYMEASAWKDFFKQISSDATSMFNKLTGQWIEMQDIAFQTGRSMAMSREMAMRYDRQLMQTTKELARQYGITAKEIADFQKSYTEATGRNIMLTKQQTESMAALQKIAGENAGTLIDEFDKIGVGIERATAYTGRFQERAKALGVSPAKATKMMADNIKLAASYSFRNGVSDIEKMSLKASSMRMDMQAVMNATEKFADIEGAISNSANIQMLGGSFAREFSNPMGAMYEAMADPKAFQDRILRTIQGKGKYDTKTGAVTFDPVTMRMMREMAKNLGMTVDQITNPAMAQVQNDKVKQELQAAGKWDKWSDIEQEAIQNLSRTNVDLETGKHQVVYRDVNGEEHKVDIEDLTKDQLKVALDQQKTEEELFGDVQEIKEILQDTLGRARGTTSTKENIKGFGEEINSFIAQFQNMWAGSLSGLLNGQHFMPWDAIRTLSWPTGQMDVGTHATEGLWEDFFSGTGKYSFKEGGIVKPVKHASLGTIIPGSSRMGDKTPIMANAGEMVLNPREQKGLFDLLKDIATTGLLAYGGNKLGKRMGMKGIGTNLAIGNLFSGMNMGVGSMLGAGAGLMMSNRMMRSMMPMGMGISPVGRMEGSITLMNPTVLMNGQTIMNGSIRNGEIVEQLENVAEAAADASKKTRGFSSRLMSLARRRTMMGGITRFMLHADRKRRAFGSRISNGWLGHFYRTRAAEVKILNAKALDKLSDLKVVKGAKNLKADIKSLFASPVVEEQIENASIENGAANVKNKPKKGKNAKATKTLKDVKKSNAVAKAAKASNETTKAVSKVGKTIGGIGKVGKILGKAAGPIGAIMAIGSAVGDISSASSQYDAKIDEINNSGMSELDKARAKDRASKEKNAGYGISIGDAVGAAAGAALGSALGPLGMIAGGWLGEKAGSFIGKGIGGLFGGGEERKFKKEQKKLFGEERIKSNGEAVKILTSIDHKLSIISSKSIGVTKTHLASPSLPDIGKKIFGSATDEVTNVINNVKESSIVKTFTSQAKEKIKYLSSDGSFFQSKKSPMDEMYSAMKTPILNDRLKKYGIDNNTINSIAEPVDSLKKTAQKQVIQNIDNKIASPTVQPIERLKTSFSLEPSSTKVQAIPDKTTYLRVNPSKQETVNGNSVNLGKGDINLNVNGTIKLEGGNKSVDLDLNKLLDDPSFRRQLTDVITKMLNENSNSGKRNMESERNNMARIYNRSGS